MTVNQLLNQSIDMAEREFNNASQEVARLKIRGGYSQAEADQASGRLEHAHGALMALADLRAELVGRGLI